MTGGRRLARVGVTLLSAIITASTAAAADPATGLVGFRVVGDSVPAPLGGLDGDPARGAAIVVDRRRGNCLACHRIPLAQPFQGEVGPSLAGIGDRLEPGQIRLRVIDTSRTRPDTLMPPYYRIEGLTDVAPEFRGRPALTAQEVEDVVAFLATLEGAP